MKKLYVGNLSWNTNESDLETAFSRFGQCSDTRIITDRNTGRSRGFGFVSFEDEAAADSAIQEMNGTVLDGRPLTVNVANDRRDSGGPRGGGRGGMGGGGRGGDRW